MARRSSAWDHLRNLVPDDTPLGRLLRDLSDDLEALGFPAHDPMSDQGAGGIYLVPVAPGDYPDEPSAGIVVGWRTNPAAAGRTVGPNQVRMKEVDAELRHRLGPILADTMSVLGYPHKHVGGDLLVLLASDE